MIEKIISYYDLLALLLGIAISGLMIFSLYLLGSILGDSDTDSDVDGDIDTDLDVDSDFDIETDLEVDTNLDIDSDISTDFSFDAGFDSSIATSIDTDGGSSFLGQLGSFALIFGLFGFFTIASLGNPKIDNNWVLTSVDIAFSFIFLLGLIAFYATKKILIILTKGAINPVFSLQTGLSVTIISDFIDHQKQGRVMVNLPDGDRIMMAQGFELDDLLFQGETGFIKEVSTPLRISRYLDPMNISK